MVTFVSLRLSSGAHLALLTAYAGCAGDPASADPVDREHSGLQAAAVFFPLTDLLSYGADGRSVQAHIAVGGNVISMRPQYISIIRGSSCQKSWGA
jgi:hypothetical protein